MRGRKITNTDGLTALQVFPEERGYLDLSPVDPTKTERRVLMVVVIFLDFSGGQYVCISFTLTCTAVIIG